MSILVNVHSANRMYVTRKSVGADPTVHQYVAPNFGFTCLLCKLRFNRVDENGSRNGPADFVDATSSNFGTLT